MRAIAVNRPASSGFAVLGIGLALVALALALLLALSGGGSPGPAPAVAGPIVQTGRLVAFWEARVAADPADFVAQNRLASAYIQRARETGDVSDYSRAQAAVDASLANLPGDNYTAYTLLASLQNVRHEFSAAAGTARQALSIDPADPSGYAVLGDAQIALGRYDEAFAAYNRLVEMAPALSSFSRLAHIYELRGDLANADGAWENAISTDGGRSAESTAWARVQFGHFYFGQGRLDDARAQYDAALTVFPDYVHAQAGLARLAAADGDYDGAIALYTGVTGRQPLPEYVAALGDVYAAAGRSADAQRQYALIDAIQAIYIENGVNTDLQMALFLADHDLRPDEAVRQALAVYGQTPDSIYAADATAWALYKAGRAEEALPYAEKALRLGTDDASLYYHAGMIYSALGDTGAAREHLGRALDINPHFSPLQAPIAESTLESLG